MGTERNDPMGKPSTPTSRLKKAAVVGAASAVLLGSAMATSPAYAAKGDFSGDPNFTGPTTNGETDKNGGVDNATQFGAYLPSGGPLAGLRVWCIDAGLDWPYADGYTESASTVKSAPQLSYMLGKWDKKRSAKTDQMSYDMALSENVHRSPEVPHRDILETRTISQVNSGIGWDMDSENVKAVGASTFKDKVVPDAIEHSSTMTSEAKKYASKSYTVKVEVAKDGADGEAKISLVNAEGKAVPGFDADLKVSGAKAEKTSITSDTKPTVVKLSDFDGSKAEVSATFKSVPTGSVKIYKPKDYRSSGYDRYDLQQIVQKQVKNVSGSDSINIVSKPKVTTTISSKELEPGDEVYDNFTVSGLHDGQKVDVVHTAYVSKTKPKQSKTVPADAKKLGTVTSKGVGNGKHKSPSLKLPKDFYGYVTWTEEIKSDDDNDGWKSDYGIPDETGFAKARPALKTTASTEKVTSVPAKVHDTGEIEGTCYPGSEITVTTEALLVDGEVEQTAQKPEEATDLGTVEQKVECGDDGKAEYETTPVELTEDMVAPGEKKSLIFRASISEDEFNTKWADDYGVPAETVDIEIPKPEEPEQPAPEQPEAPKPAPEQPAPESPTAVKTGAFLDDNGAKAGLVGGIAALLAGGIGAAVYFVRRGRKDSQD